MMVPIYQTEPCHTSEESNQDPVWFQTSNVVITSVYSSETSRLYIEDMQVYTSVFVWMLTTIIYAILKQYTILLKSWMNIFTMSVNLIWYSISTRQVFNCLPSRHDVCWFCVILNLWRCTLLQVYTVVDEMFLAGEIRETSQTKVLKQLLMLNSLE